MKRLLLIFSALCVLIGIPVEAKGPLKVKGTTKQCEVHEPAFFASALDVRLINQYVHNQDYGQSMAVANPVFWDVYSDRSGNTTYINPDADEKGAFSSLGFREKVRIAKIKKGFALVYSIPSGDVDYPSLALKGEPVDWKGWVPMRNLVIYGHTLVTDDNVDIKVLLKDDREDVGDAFLSYKSYEDPSELIPNHEIPSSSNSFFYIVKQDGDMTLLACSPKITSVTDIYGWIRSNKIIRWASRVAVQPTWAPSDVRFFTDSELGCDIESWDDSRKLIGRVSFNASYWNYFDPENNRSFSGDWSIPVLSSSESSYLLAVPCSSLLLDQPHDLIPAQEDDIHVSYDEARQTADDVPTHQTVNLFFILDGSRAYEPAFPILSEKLSEMKSIYGGECELRIGALIYHDVRNAQYQMEVHPLVDPESPSLYEFIDGGGEYGFNDNLTDAPIISALNHTMDIAGFTSDGENIVVIVGGRGDNSDTAISPSDLAERLSEKNISVYGIQFQNNPNTAAYRSFGYLLDEIVFSTIRNRLHDSDLSSDIFESKSLSYDGIWKTEFRSDRSKYAECTASISSGIMSEDQFEACLDEVLLASAAGGASSSFMPNSHSAQIFVTGVVSRNIKGRKLFKEVALYSQKELDDLIDLYNKFSAMTSSSFLDRTIFANLLTTRLKDIIKLNPDLSSFGTLNQNKFYEYGIWESLSMICGIINTSDVYPGRTIKEILNEKIVSNAEFVRLLEELSHKYDRLVLARNSQSHYAMVINGDVYYWIPVEDLI